jgi:pyruvate-ferredoxin/flavodoxin oxidoreductase
MANEYTGVVDGNEAAAIVAYRTNEVIAIYPITPSSPMGEFSDQWAAMGLKNIWGTTPEVIEMQSEAGAAGAIHGALQAGSMTTTFTASQGLLLMIPNMYKIAGELTSTVFHVAARSLAAQALSIFGDHSDVMAARSTGWAMLFANSVQEVSDFALISQMSTFEARVPFLHVFDGFRTSHEVQKIRRLTAEDVRALFDTPATRGHRARALTPEHPVIRGTAQNPDVYFQARETVNPFYIATPKVVQDAMDKFAARTGRQYGLFEYVGVEDAERVLVLMGSGCETVEETVRYLNEAGEKVGVVKVRLFRPFAVEVFLETLPATVKSIAVLDRTKEPGAIGEPLYQDVVTALYEGIASGTAPVERMPVVIGGRYGLSSKEFTPAMVKGVFDELTAKRPKNHFTVGIVDDVTHTSLDYDSSFTVEKGHVSRAVFWGLGSDGTVGANKNTVKIIGKETDNYAQGYFVYDSKKSGARTVSHLRFSPRPIGSPYLIQHAQFVGVHQFGFLDRYDTLRMADEGATLLINSPYAADKVWDQLPARVQAQIIEKKMDVHVIDAYALARELEMGVRINTIMQTAYFALSGVIPQEQAITKIKDAIEKTYGRRGEAIVKRNFAAVDAALSNLHRVTVPDRVSQKVPPGEVVSEDAPEFVREVTARMLADEGDSLPVSALPKDGTYPTATTQWEKRNISQEVPVWETDLCIQCGKCVMVCPHSVIRGKVYDPARLADAPETFRSMDARWRELPDRSYTLQVAVEDCTGCRLCVEVCPAKDKSRVGRKALNMQLQAPIRERERVNWDFFLSLPEVSQDGNDEGEALKFSKVRDVQLLEPLFEFSSACAGCGETPYLRLLTQLFGSRMVVANATGCSSIYGGNLPTTPWSKDKDGRGPAWNNSLFEDNAEFGLGLRAALDKQAEYARTLTMWVREEIGPDLAKALIKEPQDTAAEIAAQRERVAELKAKLAGRGDATARDLHSVADSLVKKSVWIVGGDGWAYDIGFGGLDHVLASGRNVNILVLDTEVYSNTGGQSSKATPVAAVAKFAASGKATPKKDIAMIAMNYGHVYVAQVALGADDNHTIKVFQEAESWEGPSLIIAYSQCIAHGIDMAKGMDQQKLAVASGHWPLFRYDPRLDGGSLNPFQLDSKPPKIPLQDYIYNENRYRMLLRTQPRRAAELLKLAENGISERWRRLKHLAHQTMEE